MYCLPLAEVKACPNHTSVVEHHQRTLWQMLGKMAENIRPDSALTIHQQFACIAPLKGELCYPFIGKRIVVVLYLNMLRLHYFANLGAKVRFFSELKSYRGRKNVNTHIYTITLMLYCVK